MKISAGIIIRYGDKILFCHPANSVDNFGPPKGGQEEGETLLETAIRETREEVGIDITNIKSNVLDIPIEVIYKNKSKMEYKKVYLYLLDIKHLSEVGLTNEIVPKNQLQHKEIKWAGFLNKEGVRPRIFHRFKHILNLI
jgi:8-oxo-dGTP pyrophosphatase MutT (NUDIX family)